MAYAFIIFQKDFILDVLWGSKYVFEVDDRVNSSL